MRDSHKKIIDAIIKKASRVCPGSLAMIAVYGSAATGDEYEKSDLDLLILINDDRGWQLGSGFILDDEQIGYDIYCTTWNGLEEDAKCRHAHLNKLLDSKIVYVSEESVESRYEKIKESAIGILQSEKRYEAVESIKSELYQAYAKAMLSKGIGEMRAYAANVISTSLDAVMVWNGRYFKKGMKRTFDELATISLPDNYAETIMSVISAKNMPELKEDLTTLVRLVLAFTKREPSRELPSMDNISGTYEEMYSNWRNKMFEAINRGDSFASFMNLASLYFMMKEISEEVQITVEDVMEEYNSKDLAGNAAIYDKALEKYLEAYHKAGIEPRHFADVNAFVEEYEK